METYVKEFHQAEFELKIDWTYLSLNPSIFDAVLY